MRRVHLVKQPGSSSLGNDQGHAVAGKQLTWAGPNCAMDDREFKRAMISPDQHQRFHKQLNALEGCIPDDWRDIAALLDKLTTGETAPLIPACKSLLKSFGRGAAFLTFNVGIDGVSIEIAKYGRALCDLLSSSKDASLHMIAGNFKPEADTILEPAWHRFRIEGIDGWNKWHGGRWFEALFRNRMPAQSAESTDLAREVFRQAIGIASNLGDYLIEHEISLLTPVNIASNPGNLALTLGLVLTTEILGSYVLNINHDYYWEGGRPESAREPGEPPGVRDHFFRNRRNRSFFSLFESMYPWNGRRWLQVNINTRQSRKLIDRYDFARDKVSEISTIVDDAFFQEFSREDVVSSRLRMAHILSDGDAILRPVSIDHHRSRIAAWMHDQRPVVVGARPGLTVDPRSDDLIILLQPTRIVRRKRIERDLALIDALLKKSELRREFEDNPGRQLILHITGPTPREHRRDLERVLDAYRATVGALPGSQAERIFIAFSVGQETHPSFAAHGFQQLTIDAIYRMADAVVFPSKTEGRGLPIIESGACGIPIICSQYQHREVFDEVVGKQLPEELQIRYIVFPEGRFSAEFLSTVSKLLIHPEHFSDMIRHNRTAVRARYGQTFFEKSLQRLLERLCELE
jgi:glycosyltransferase involved in cell wall biosynthesis